MAQKETGHWKDNSKKKSFNQQNSVKTKKGCGQTQLTHYRRPLNPSMFCGLDASNLNSEFKNPSSILATTFSRSVLVIAVD